MTYLSDVATVTVCILVEKGMPKEYTAQYKVGEERMSIRQKGNNLKGNGKGQKEVKEGVRQRKGDNDDDTIV